MVNLRRLVNHPKYALANFGLVVICSAASYLFPQLTPGLILIAMLPWLVRLVVHPASIHLTILDLCLVVFGLTAALGWWSAYNPVAATVKFWRIIMAILLCYAVKIQPRENWVWISVFAFSISLGLSAYFLLTFNAEQHSADYRILNQIGLWWSSKRPSLGWEVLNPNFTSGVAAVTGVLGIALLKRFYAAKQNLLLVCSVIGFGVILFAIGLSSSRGTWLAVLGAIGFSVIYLFYKRFIGFNSPAKSRVFLRVIPVYVIAVIIFIYALTNYSGIPVESQASPYAGGRLELLRNTLQLLPDYPFTGAGLESFPGLYAHYILGIKNFYLANSRNLFLDIALEQGILGLIAVVLIFTVTLSGVFRLALEVDKPADPELVFWGWLVIFAFMVMIFHGIVEDNFYFRQGTVLSLFIPGVAMSVLFKGQPAITRIRDKKTVSKITRNMILAAGIVVFLLAMIPLNWGKIRSAWYANSGAVVMAQGELALFPEQGDFKSIQPYFQQAEVSFGRALKLNPENTTALYRLGLLAFDRNDFSQATSYLEKAHTQNPFHRGITKYLGYSCTWSGDFDEASVLLTNIPEAQYELDLYSWWWGTQGEDEYAKRSAQMVTILENNH